MGVDLEIKGKGIEHDISALATQFALPTSKAHDLLWDEIHDLEQVARIRDFVLILALKHVKDHLRDRPH
jgi:hypothetical protein